MLAASVVMLFFEASIISILEKLSTTTRKKIISPLG
jgi:hypothetical protein